MITLEPAVGPTPRSEARRGFDAVQGPMLVMAIAVFMILTQLGIAPVIVTATYIALIGALALASAFAFGLGGRDTAAELINSGYRKAQQQTDSVGVEARLARERGERDARWARERAGAPAGTGAHPATTLPTERGGHPKFYPRVEET